MDGPRGRGEPRAVRRTHERRRAALAGRAEGARGALRETSVALAAPARPQTRALRHEFVAVDRRVAPASSPAPAGLFAGEPGATFGLVLAFGFPWRDADEAPGTAALFPHHRAHALEAARRCPRGGMGRGERRSLGHRAAHAAAGASAAHRHGATPRRAALVVARVRHAGGLLAAESRARPPEHRTVAHLQRARLRSLSAGRGGSAG